MAGQTVVFFGGAGLVDMRLKNVEVVAPGLKSVHEGAGIGRVLRGFWNLRAARVIRRSLALLSDSKEPRVALVHSYTKVLSPIVFSECRRAGIPVVFIMHDHFAFCPNGNYFQFPRNVPCDCRPLSSQCWTTNCDSRGRWVKSVRMLRSSMISELGLLERNCAGFIAVSSLGLSFARNFLPGRKIELVRNPLPVSSGGRNEGHEGNGRPVYIGRLTRSKGVLVLAEAARDANLRIDFVGEGECEAELQNRFPEARCWGWLPRGRTQVILRNSSLLVLPSLWPETFGLTVAEALSQGVPALVSTRAGAAELISPGQNGWLWNPSRIADLPELLKQVREPNRLRMMSESASRIYAAEEQGIEPHARNLTQALGRLLTSRGVA